MNGIGPGNIKALIMGLDLKLRSLTRVTGKHCQGPVTTQGRKVDDRLGETVKIGAVGLQVHCSARFQYLPIQPQEPRVR